jgi:hypothetical protein
MIALTNNNNNKLNKEGNKIKDQILEEQVYEVQEEEIVIQDIKFEKLHFK